MGNVKKTKTRSKTASSYVNVNRAKRGYKDKYKKDVEEALGKYLVKIGKNDKSQLTVSDWKKFYKTVLIPLDKDSERHMIDLFKKDRKQLNDLLVLHNIKAGKHVAEVYYKKYERMSPTKWHDLEDFHQMALEGLSIAAKKFNLDSGNRFLTYATWWVMNRVQRTTNEKGAKLIHTSFSSPVGSSSDEDNKSTFEDVFTPDMVSQDWDQKRIETSPVDNIERMDSESEFNECNLIKHTSRKDVCSLDKDKVLEITNKLMTILETHSNNDKDRQILLFMFKRIFSHCDELCDIEKPTNGFKVNKLKNYVSQAAKTKGELLNRLHMNEEQYEQECSKLTKLNYDGV
mgnify:CR=1 FL=1